MEWLFGRRMTPEEQLKKNQRALNKAMRELDRERAKMEQQEKKIIADIKKMAKQGQMDAVKIMAKVRSKWNRLFALESLFLFSGFSQNQEICQEIHVDESQHSGGVSENSNTQVTKLDGSGHEGRHQGDDEHEQADEAA